MRARERVRNFIAMVIACAAKMWIEFVMANLKEIIIPKMNAVAYIWKQVCTNIRGENSDRFSLAKYINEFYTNVNWLGMPNGCGKIFNEFTTNLFILRYTQKYATNK